METINFVSKEKTANAGDKITLTRSVKKNWAYLNLEYLETIDPGNTEFFKTMLNLFRDNSNNYIQLMKSQASSNDYDNLAKTAHAMKPTGAYVGLSALAVIMSELEKKAKAHLNTDIFTLLAQVQTLVNNVVLEINEYLTLNA